MVHVVTHKQLKKDYAAKMIDRSLCDNEELAKEVAIMQEVEEHPGVIHLKDVYEEAGSSKFVLILELYDTTCFHIGSSNVSRKKFWVSARSRV